MGYNFILIGAVGAFRAFEGSSMRLEGTFRKEVIYGV